MYLFALTLLFVSVNCAVIPENKPQLSSEYALPDIQKICANDINVDQCIRQAVSDVVSKLYSQLPPLRLSIVDPVVAAGLRQSTNSNGPTKIYSNSNVTEVNIYFPKIVVEGTYQADMRYQGSNKVTSGPFNVAMSRPEPSQMPVVNSILGDGLASTGDFLVNLGPSILQNIPGVNVAQKPQVPIPESKPQVTEQPQIPNLNFIGIKPKTKIVVANPNDQVNQQFVPPNFIRPSATQDSTIRPAPVTKPTIPEILIPSPDVIDNSGEFDVNTPKLPENEPSLEPPPEPIVPPILKRPTSTEDSSERPKTENRPDNQPTLDTNLETSQTPVVPPILVRPPPTEESSTIGTVVDTKPIEPENSPSTFDIEDTQDMENAPNIETGPNLSIESNADTPIIPESESSVDDAPPSLSSDSQTSSQDFGEDSPQPASVDNFQTSPEQKTAEQPIIQDTPTSDAIADSDTQINEKPGEDSSFTSDSEPSEDTSLTSNSEPSIPMNIPEDSPSVTQTSDSSIPFDDMTISSVDFILPSFVKPCDEDDPDFDICLREAIWAIIPSLYNEYQPFQIRRLNPLNTERAHIDYDSGYFQVAADFENIVTRGLNEAMYRDMLIKISNDVVRADVNLFLPKISLEARYNAEFEYNGLKIPSSGPFNVTMADIDMTQKWTGRFITKNQHKYLKVDRIEMIPAVGSVNFILDNSLSGEPKNDIAVTFLNQNWADMYKEMVKSTRSSWEPIMIVAVNEFLGRLPFDMLTIPKAKQTPISTTVSTIDPKPITSEETIDVVQSVMSNMPSETNVAPMETTSSVDVSEIPDESLTSSGILLQSEQVGDTKLPTLLPDDLPEANEAPVQPMIVDEPVSSTEATVPQVPSVDEIIKSDDIKPCYEEDLDYDQCVRTAVYKILPQLYEKFRPLQRPLLDPLIIKNAHIDYDPGYVEVAIDFDKMSAFGMNEAELRDIGLRIYTDRARIEVNLFYPKIILMGNYDVRVQYKGHKFPATGPVNVTMTDIDMAQVWKGDFVNKNGHRYLKLDSIEMIPEIGSANFELGRVMDPARKDIAINFLNQNWRIFYKKFVTGTSSYWEPIMITYLNEFLENLPFDALMNPNKTVLSTPASSLTGYTTISDINLQDTIQNTIVPTEEDIALPGETEEDIVLPGEEESMMSPTKGTVVQSTSSSQIANPAIGEELSENGTPSQAGQPCKQNDPSFDQCIQESVSAIIPGLFAAIKPFQSAQIDPLNVPTAKIEYNNDILQSVISVENLATHGMSQAQYRDAQLKIDGDNVRVDFKIFFPQLSLDGIYNADIKFTHLDLHPVVTGPFNVTMYDIEMTQNWKGHFVTRNGHRYVEIDEIEMSPEVGRVDFHEAGDFPDEGTKEIAIVFLNANWGGMYKLLVPATRAFWEPPIKNALNQFLSGLPFDALITSVGQEDTVNDSEPQMSSSSGELLSPPVFVEPVTSLPEAIVSSASPVSHTISATTENEIKEEVISNVPPADISISTEEFILPDSIEPCVEADISFDSCVRDAFWRISQIYFIENNPFRDIQLNPLYTEMALIEYNPGNSKKTISFEKFSTYGFNDTELRDMQMRVYSESVQTEVSLRFPRLFVEGRYKAEIEYGGLQLSPMGPFNVTMDDVQVVQNWRGHFVNRNQHRYLQLDVIKMTPEVGAVNARVEGVFNDQRGAIVEDYLNRHWNAMYGLLLPASNSSWEPIMINAINKFLDRLPLDFINLENTNIDEPLPSPVIVNQVSSPVTSLPEPSASSKSPMTPSVPAPTENVLKEEASTLAPPLLPTEKPISTGEFMLPESIQPCLESDIGFDACVREAVWRLAQIYFIENNPFRDIQLNPLYTEAAQIEFNPGDSKKIIDFEQFSTYGFNNTELRDMRMRVYSEGVQTEVSLLFPRLFVEGRYKAEIEYSGLKLSPMGPFNVTMDEVQVVQNWRGQFVYRNQHRYLQIDEIKMTPEVGAVNARVEGVFNDQRGPIVEAYLNRNWNTMYGLLVTASNSSWEPVMINAINKFLDRLPLDFINLENTNIDEPLPSPVIVNPVSSLVTSLPEPTTSSESPMTPSVPAPIENEVKEEAPTIAPPPAPTTDKPISTGEFMLPDSIQPCLESDVGFDACVREAVWRLAQIYFIENNPFRDIQLNPLYTEMAQIEFNPGDSKKIIDFEQFSTYGFNNTELRDMRMRVYSEGVQTEVSLLFPRLFVEGRYKAEIEYSGLKLSPMGPFNVTMDDVQVVQNWRGQFVYRNQHRYLQIDEIKMTPEVGAVNARVEGVFNDQRGPIVEAYLNRNWNTMYGLLVTASNSSWEPVMINAINKFLDRLPLDFINLENTNIDEPLPSPVIVNPVSSLVTSLPEPTTSSESPMTPSVPAPIENEVKEEASTLASLLPSTEKPISTGEFMLPDSIQPCLESDVGFDACVREAVWNLAQIYFIENNPFRDIQLNPLYTETAQIEFNPGDSKKIIDFEKFSTYGFNNTELRDMRMRVYSEGVQTEVSLLFPRLFVEGRYKAEIEYSGLKLSPMGPFNVTMDEVQVVQNWRGQFVYRNQHRYLQIDEIKMTPEVGAVNARVEGVFNDQRGPIVEAYLNRNWNTMYGLLVTASNSSWEPVMINAINKFLDRLPLDFINLENTNIDEPLPSPVIVNPVSSPVTSLPDPSASSESPMTPSVPAPIKNEMKEEAPTIAPPPAPTTDKPISTGEFMLPDSIQPCLESDVGFDACVREAVWTLAQIYFIENNPFRDIQLNPLYTKTAQIEFNPGDSKKIIDFEQFSTYGFNNTELRDMRMRVYSEGVQTEVSLLFPRLFVEGRYKAEIEYSGLKLSPMGPFNVTMDEVQVVQNWRGQFVYRNQHRYLQIDEIKMIPEVGAVNARVEGVFNDQRGPIVEAYLNRNWNTMYGLLVTASNSSWEPVMINAINKFLDRLPLDFINLENTNIDEPLPSPVIVKPVSSPVTSLPELSTSSESPMTPSVSVPIENEVKEEAPTLAPLLPSTEKPISTGEFMLPDSIEPCLEADIGFDACVRDAVWRLAQIYFIENNPFRDVQLNPLYTETAQIEFNPGDSKKIIDFEQFSTHGFNNTELRDMRLRVYSEGVQTEVSLLFPRLFVEGRYKAEIEYSGLKLSPMGPFNVTMDEVQVVQNWRGQFVYRNQHRYLQINEIKMTPEVGAVNARVEGVFNDQRGPIVEAYLNRNWNTMYGLLVTASNSSWEPVMINAINKFLDRLPLDFINLENTNIDEPLPSPVIVNPVSSPVTSLPEPSTSSELPMTPSVPPPIENEVKEEASTLAPLLPSTEKPISDGEFMLPDSIQPCLESDVGFDACVREAVWSLAQIYFIENNPFRDIQLNPLYTETAQIEFNPGDSKKIIDFEQFSTYGFNNTELRDMRMRVYSEGVQTEVSLLFPRLFVDGRYKAEIEYSGLKLSPMGPFNVTMDEVQVVQNWRGQFVNRNQQRYLQINEIKMIPEVGAVNARVEGVFNDQRGPIVEAYLNRNWNTMYGLLVTASSSSWEPVMVNAINKFLDRLPLDFIKLQNEN